MMVLALQSLTLTKTLSRLMKNIKYQFIFSKQTVQIKKAAKKALRQYTKNLAKLIIWFILLHILDLKLYKQQKKIG